MSDNLTTGGNVEGENQQEALGTPTGQDLGTAKAQAPENGSASLLNGNPAAATKDVQDKQGEGKQAEDKQEQVPFTLEELEVPEGFSARQEDIQRFHETALGMGLTKAQAQQLVDMQHANVLAAQEQHAAHLAQWKNEIKMDKEMGGAAFEQTDMYATASLRKFDEDGKVFELLDSSGYKNHPEIIRFLSRVGKAMGEDGVVTGKETGQQKALEDRLYPSTNK